MTEQSAIGKDAARSKGIVASWTRILAITGGCTVYHRAVLPCFTCFLALKANWKQSQPPHLIAYRSPHKWITFPLP